MTEPLSLFASTLQPDQLIEVSIAENTAITLIWCPAGEFLMGSSETDIYANSFEHPQHRVQLTCGFWIGQTQVTQAQWEIIMGSKPRLFQDGSASDLIPAEGTWADAKAFCMRLTTNLQKRGILTGMQRADLPTEAQWEYACRAGTQTSWYFGDKPADLDKHGWYMQNSEKQKHPVARKIPNPRGVYDFYGNVMEWCLDDLFLYEPLGGSRIDPYFPKDASMSKIVRGGAFDAMAKECRSAARRSIDVNNGYKEPVGLRIICVDG